MTATADTMAAIQELIQQLRHAVAAAGAAASRAEAGRNLAAQVGNHSSIAGFTQVHQVLVGEVTKTIGAAIQLADQAIGLTKAIEGG